MSPLTVAVRLQSLHIPHKLTVHNLLQNLVISLSQENCVQIKAIIALSVLQLRWLRQMNIMNDDDNVYLTLRLLMSYIYGAPSKARNVNVVYIWA